MIVCMKSWILVHQFSRLLVKVSWTVLQYGKEKHLEIQMYSFCSPAFGWVSFWLNCVLVSAIYRSQRLFPACSRQQHQSGSSLDTLSCSYYPIRTAKLVLGQCEGPGCPWPSHKGCAEPQASTGAPGELCLQGRLSHLLEPPQWVVTLVGSQNSADNASHKTGKVICQRDESQAWTQEGKKNSLPQDPLPAVLLGLARKKK